MRRNGGAGELGAKTSKIGSGITPAGGDTNYRQSGRPFVRSQNVGWGELLLEDVAFIDEVYARGDKEVLDRAFNSIWARRIPKVQAHGIHGLLFYELEAKKSYYPSRKDEDASNPDGTPLR